VDTDTLRLELGTRVKSSFPSRFGSFSLVIELASLKLVIELASLKKDTRDGQD
jgi:hypothetical protein